MRPRLAHSLSIVLTLGAILAASSEARIISASGLVSVSGGVCSSTTSASFYDETCVAPGGTEGRALASVSATGGLPSLGALASITTFPGSVGGSATGVAEVEDQLILDFATASIAFMFAVDGIITTSGTRGDGPAAYYEFVGNGRFTFDEFSPGSTGTTLTTGDIPTPGGRPRLFPVAEGARGCAGGRQPVR